MSKPVIASSTPFAVDVEQGKTYFWCQCGLSNKQPFCDGSHRDTDIEPVKFQAANPGKVYFCGCKQTGGPPLCDGTHNKIQGAAD